MFSLNTNARNNSAANAAVALAMGLNNRLAAFGEHWHHHRPQRVTGLLVLVAALGALDAGMTVQQMSTTGMFEDNPLARLIVASTGSAIPLIAFKLLSLMVSMGMLFGLRRHWQAEIGAWVAAAVLVWLTAQWGMYLHFMFTLDSETIASLANHGGWVLAR